MSLISQPLLTVSSQFNKSEASFDLLIAYFPKQVARLRAIIMREFIK